jgi:hypothetical protein
LLPVPDIEKLRTRARQAIGNLACGGVDVAVSERGDLAAAGYVANQADRDRIAAGLKAPPDVGQVDNAIEVKTWPLCEVLGVLHEEVAIEVGGPSAPRIDPGGPYHEGKDPLNLTVTPLRDGYLYVDYIDAANEDPTERYALHLLPSPLRDSNNFVKAGRSWSSARCPKRRSTFSMSPLAPTWSLPS